MKFTGKVFQSGPYQKLQGSFPQLIDYTDAFKKYWAEGFHPYIGKDIATSYPNPPEGHRHVHLQPPVFPAREEIRHCVHLSYTDSEVCWAKWGRQQPNPAVDANSHDIPTSDLGLFYAVDSDRNAYLLHYQQNDLHAFMNSAECTDLIGEFCDLLQDGHGKRLLSFSEQQELFSKKWLGAE